MYGEDLLTAYTVGNTANGDGLVDAAMLLSNDSAFESLVTLAAAFLYADGDTDGIADIEGGQFGLHVLFTENFDQIHSLILPLLKAFMSEDSLGSRQRTA